LPYIFYQLNIIKTATRREVKSKYFYTAVTPYIVQINGTTLYTRSLPHIINYEIKSTFKIWKTNRKLYLDYFEKYSLEQLNETPNEFSNNLIWNIGHIIVAQQVLIYDSSDLEGCISEELLNLYRPGTKPVKQTS